MNRRCRKLEPFPIFFVPGAGLLALAVALASPGRGEDSTVAVAQLAVPAPQVELWIQQLDANRFNTREVAHRQLEEAGMTALEAVAAAAASGPLEGSTRAVNILLSWSESSNHQLRITALEKLAALGNRPREAGMASELLADAREQAALEAIAAWGGQAVEIRGPFRQRRPYLQVAIDSQWQGGHEGLNVLANVRRAAIVNLYSVPVEDELVPVLLKLPHLYELRLYGTDVSPAAVQQLRQSIRNVDVRSGALLGIQGDPDSRTPRIKSIVAGGAAEKAGLKLDDSITELNGKPVADFTALTQRIAEYEPGDSAVLTVLRDGQRFTKTVKFQQWTIESMPHQNVPGRVVTPRRGKGAGVILPPPQILIDRR